MKCFSCIFNYLQRKKKLNYIPHCPVCLLTFKELFQLNALTCGHVICLSCCYKINNHFKHKNIIKCPLCCAYSYAFYLINNCESCVKCNISLYLLSTQNNLLNFLSCGHTICFKCAFNVEIKQIRNLLYIRCVKCNFLKNIYPLFI